MTNSTPDKAVSLKTRLIEQITLEGPMTVADYMARCLLDPIDGYYTTRPALGPDGDFITAPLISQMFGEMIGVWVAQTWLALGSPQAFHLVELGGGDGTLMSDILRVAKQVPGLREAARLVMLEPSPALRAQQAAIVPDAAFPDDMRDIPDDLPLIVIANEVLDCLPARQYVRTDEGWRERLVGLDDDGSLCFGLQASIADFLPDNGEALGALLEISPEQQRFTLNWADKLKQTTGALLLIDYGRAEPGTGDSLQALSRHEKRDPLDEPGHHDLTIWADFPVIARIAADSGLGTTAITPQRAFLQDLGIDARLAALSTKNPDQAAKLQRQYERLMAPDQMGDLFKVLAMAFPANLPLFALEPAPTQP